MKYYLLNEQDIAEIIWDIENFTAEIKEKIEKKEIWQTEAGSGEDQPAEG